jgi:septal ring factor EnvC (AmiA/AmiB activator)
LETVEKLAAKSSKIREAQPSVIKEVTERKAELSANRAAEPQKPDHETTQNNTKMPEPRKYDYFEVFFSLRLSLKKFCTSVRHSSARTPEVISI